MVAGAGSGSDLGIEVVLDHNDLLRTIRVRLKYALNRSVCRLALTAGDVPPKKTLKLAKAIENTYALRIINSK